MECKICFTKFNENQRTPRILTNCGHTLCQLCIVKQKKHGEIVCPFDRTVTKLDGGADQLHKNYALLELVEKSQISKSESSHEPEIISSNSSVSSDVLSGNLSDLSNQSNFISVNTFLESSTESDGSMTSMESFSTTLSNQSALEDYEYLHDMYL